MSNDNKCIIKITKEGSGLFSIYDIEAGEKILKLDGFIVTTPDKYTLQIDVDKHLFGLEDSSWVLFFFFEKKNNYYLKKKFLNHSCNPNGKIELTEDGYIYFTASK